MNKQDYIKLLQNYHYTSERFVGGQAELPELGDALKALNAWENAYKELHGEDELIELMNEVEDEGVSLV
ncbi:hypothetical protein IIW_00333 [Bacillus cereus VD136]|nr:hypothetical protein IIW_00333 [Bacillus cereus VD136]